MVLPNARLSDMGWNSLIAIQSSAFLMTLFRKGLIRWKSHAFWYGIALVLSYNYIRMANPGFYFWAKVLAVFGMRVKLRMDKYVIWLIFAIFSMTDMDPLFWSYLIAKSNIYLPKTSNTVYFSIEVGTGSYILAGLAFGFLDKKLSPNLL